MVYLAHRADVGLSHPHVAHGMGGSRQRLFGEEHRRKCRVLRRSYERRMRQRESCRRERKWGSRQMKFYKISDEYRTGNDRIDQQHAKMLDYTWRAHELCADENMLFKSDDIQKILEGLEYYTIVHFAEEEEFMEQIGFDGIEAHRKQHDNFRAKIRSFIERVPELSLATQDDMLGEVFEYLQDWWKVHITHEDRKYVEFEQKNGLIPEEA